MAFQPQLPLSPHSTSAMSVKSLLRWTWSVLARSQRVAKVVSTSMGWIAVSASALRFRPTEG
eukprot:3346932-Alexandrium_andersonii.AAC.1